MATEILRPSAAGVETNLSPNGATNWQMVDEDVADDDTTWVRNPDSSGTTYLRDLYDLPASSGSGTINSVKVYVRCKFNLAYTKAILRSDSTVTEGSPQIMTSSWTPYTEQWNNNPVGGSWEWADIDALQIGVSLGGLAGAYATCTQVYVEVDYTPPPPVVTVGGSPLATLIDAGII